MASSDGPLKGTELAVVDEDAWQEIEGQEKAEEVDIRGAKMQGGCFKNWSFYKCDMRGMDLSGLDFTKAEIRYCDLRGAKLDSAVLIEADLSYSALDGASLVGANLDQCRVNSTVFVNANLGGATLTHINFREAKSYLKANLKESYTFETIFKSSDEEAQEKERMEWERTLSKRWTVLAHPIIHELQVLKEVWKRQQDWIETWMEIPLPATMVGFKEFAAAYREERREFFEGQIEVFEGLYEMFKEMQDDAPKRMEERQKLFRYGQPVPPLPEYPNLCEGHPLFYTELVKMASDGKLKCLAGHHYKAMEPKKDDDGFGHGSTLCSRCESSYELYQDDFMHCEKGEKCRHEFLCPSCVWSRMVMFERKPIMCPVHKDREMPMIERSDRRNLVPDISLFCILCKRDVDKVHPRPECLICVPCKKTYCSHCMLLLKSELYERFISKCPQPSGDEAPAGNPERIKCQEGHLYERADEAKLKSKGYAGGEFRCSRCGQFEKLKTGAMRCDDCEINLCSKCWTKQCAGKDQGPLAAEKLFCPKSHPLKQTDTYHAFTCDWCRASVGSAPSLHCDACDFDLCPKCARNPAPELRRRAAAALNPAPQGLVCKCSRALRPLYNCAFTCNLCMKSYDEELSMNCAACDFDCCPTCSPSMRPGHQSAAAGSSAQAAASTPVPAPALASGGYKCSKGHPLLEKSSSTCQYGCDGGCLGNFNSGSPVYRCSANCGDTICPACAEKQTKTSAPPSQRSPDAKKSPSCSRGHALLPPVPSPSGFGCDGGCRKSYGSGTPVHKCAQNCGDTLCAACFQKQL